MLEQGSTNGAQSDGESQAALCCRDGVPDFIETQKVEEAAEAASQIKLT